MPIAPLALLLLTSRLSDEKADAILKQTAQVYASLSTFSVSGRVVVTAYEESKKVMEETRPFRVWFKKPGGLRLEIVDPPREVFPATMWVVWTGKAGKFNRWTGWSGDRVVQQPMPDVFLDGGIEMDTVSEVAVKLLMPQASRLEPVTNMQEAKIVRTELVDGHQCAVIEGDFDGFSQTLWIEQKSMLIRRFDSRTKSMFNGKMETDATTVFMNPVANPKLPMNIFSFVPPKKKKG